MQPYLNLFAVCPCRDEVVVRPYISLFDSSHLAKNNLMAEMSDVMLGATTNWRGLLVDARYAYCNTNPEMRSNLHELGVKASVDILAHWQKPASLRSFSLRPFAGVYAEVFDQVATE